MNGKPVLLLSQADLDEGDDLTLDQAAQRVLARMEAQRTGLQEQFNQRYLLISAGKALAGALLLALFYYGAFRTWRRVRRFFQLRILEKRSAIPQHWRRFLGNIEVRLYAALAILVGVLACYLSLIHIWALLRRDKPGGESASPASAITSYPLARFAAWRPARVPKMMISATALPPIRLPPWIPPTTSPAA